MFLALTNNASGDPVIIPIAAMGPFAPARRGEPEGATIICLRSGYIDPASGNSHVTVKETCQAIVEALRSMDLDVAAPGATARDMERDGL